MVDGPPPRLPEDDRAEMRLNMGSLTTNPESCKQNFQNPRHQIAPRKRFRLGLACGPALAALALMGTLAAQQPATTLHVFTNGTDGGQPSAALTADSKGNLFGTTWSGGDL